MRMYVNMCIGDWFTLRFMVFYVLRVIDMMNA